MRFLKAWFNRTFRKARIEAIIRELHFTKQDGKFDAKVKIDAPGINILAEMMVQAFRAAGGINYFDFSALDPSSLEVYTLSIQRQNGRKPAEVNRILKDALVQIIEMNRIKSSEYFIALGALNKCGYLMEDGTLAGGYREE